jgi:hypothetical protein
MSAPVPGSVITVFNGSRQWLLHKDSTTAAHSSTQPRLETQPVVNAP